jgi:hypothetical protein
LSLGKVERLTRPRVAALSGVCTVIAKARSQMASRGTSSMPSSAARSAVSTGSKPITCIFRPLARSATMRPMLPRPITPSVLPASSRPSNFFFSHLPAFIDWLACGIIRASDIKRAMACSAVVTALPVGVFITTMPRFEAAGTSTLSTPIPARPMTRRRSAQSSTFAVTLEPERMTSASAPVMAAASSASPRPGW